MVERNQQCDICIVCALYEEASAVIDEFQARCSVSFNQAFSRLDQYEYRWTVIQNSFGEPLTVLVTWLPASGAVRMGLDLRPILEEFQPRFAAMTGFCAGYKEKVRLGDLVIAEYAYHYEEGKILNGPEEQRQHQPEMKTAHPTDRMIQYALGFDGWKKPASDLKRLLLQDFEPPERHIAPMASGMAVRADNPFPWLTEHRNRETLGLDMEAATFYLALRTFPHIHALVVKGVCDYADMQKNDHYHDFAARVSAVYLLHFIQAYVTTQTMPRQPTLHRTETKQWNNKSPELTDIRVLSGPSREGNKGMILFVLNGTEHTLEYIRLDKLSHQILFLKEQQQELVRLVVPFATFRSVEKQATFQIDSIDGLLTFKMSAITSIMNIKVEIGGVEVFHN